uniref:Uncharacterized protein n=1 Tax=Knipowitschia caucasica TaxID=637954 RepID=A0AAV2MEP6_KNICA
MDEERAEATMLLFTKARDSGAETVITHYCPVCLVFFKNNSCLKGFQGPLLAVVRTAPYRYSCDGRRRIFPATSTTPHLHDPPPPRPSSSTTLLLHNPPPPRPSSSTTLLLHDPPPPQPSSSTTLLLHDPPPPRPSSSTTLLLHDPPPPRPSSSTTLLLHDPPPPRSLEIPKYVVVLKS